MSLCRFVRFAGIGLSPVKICAKGGRVGAVDRPITVRAR